MREQENEPPAERVRMDEHSLDDKSTVSLEVLADFLVGGLVEETKRAGGRRESAPGLVAFSSLVSSSVLGASDTSGVLTFT